MLLRQQRSCFLLVLALSFALRLSAMAADSTAHRPAWKQAPGEARASPASPELPRFEVVSVKLNPDPNGRFSLRFTPDGFSTRHCPLKVLVIVAFHLKDARLLVNLPEGKEVFYDIEAKVSEGDVARFTKLSDVQKQSMLQSLLAERFQLKSHMVVKELPVYALVIDKHGLKLADAKPRAGGKIERTMQMTGRYTVVATGWAMEDFFQLLSELSGRYVVDRTGLTGRYDFTLRCAPDPSTDPRQDMEWDGPVIFTALRDQLGLALEPSKAMLDAVVIDHVEAPTPN